MKSTLSSIHNKEILANNTVFDKDMEIRRLKNELNDYRNKTEMFTEELTSKKKEAHDLKLDLCNLTSEIKNLRNEISLRDKQVCMLKDRLNETNMDVNISKFLNNSKTVEFSLIEFYLKVSNGSIGYQRPESRGKGMSNQDVRLISFAFQVNLKTLNRA